VSAVPTIGLIGGTGLNELSNSTEYLAIETPYGSPAAEIQVIQAKPVRLLFLPRHGSPHSLPPHAVNYRANLWALRQAGARQVIAVYAVGGLCEPYAPATLAAPDQLIDYTWGRQHTLHDSDNVPLVHIDFTHPYEGPLRRALVAAAGEAALTLVDGGCIGVFQGPRLETAAEIRRALADGCHMAGMTALPEASLARELGMDYAGIAVVSNWGAGVAGDHISEEDIAAMLVEPMQRVRQLIKALLAQLPESGV
jgi:5'-deoxy-5'-methylthioadenosine phosphorylase